MRPRLMMTALSACIGLLPAAVSTAIGSQVQRPLAMMIVGAMLRVPLVISIHRGPLALELQRCNFSSLRLKPG
jgi:heavy metal efflux system protein